MTKPRPTPFVTGVALALLVVLLAAQPAHAKAKVKVTFKDGTLTVSGTNANESVLVTRAAKKVTVKVNGKKVKVKPAPKPKALARVLVKGKGGNDTLKVVETGGAIESTTFDAGAGNDTMVSGKGNSVFLGGTGNDTLTAGAGFSSAIGGDGADTLKGGIGPSILTGGNDADILILGSGVSTLAGGTGDDSYRLDGDATGLVKLIENPGQGKDVVSLAATSTVAVTLDLGNAAQAPTPSLGVVLSSAQAFEGAIGGALADTLKGNALDNVLTGGPGTDTFVHHGAGDGIDTVTDLSSPDLIKFVTGGSLSAADMTIDATATQVRDAATATFGFDLGVSALNSTTSYTFAETDQATPGHLHTWNGLGGFTLGTVIDSLIATYASNGATIGGAGLRDRIIDHSPNANTLVGRDGSDVLVGGAGTDTLDGDNGFVAGSNDVLTGGTEADTFVIGSKFSSSTPFAFGNDTITDIDTADTVDLVTGLSVHSGLGTTVVTIWNGANDFGTITAGNGRVWIAGDFT